MGKEPVNAVNDRGRRIILPILRQTSAKSDTKRVFYYAFTDDKRGALGNGNQRGNVGILTFTIGCAHLQKYETDKLASNIPSAVGLVGAIGFGSQVEIAFR